ncbi:MAG: hypothetical protein LBC56_05645 [Oscillospiraceae bacterium]|jgi:hypothetical protein|nr:hypothetical protein [Oscillospiraceae bacterium]
MLGKLLKHEFKATYRVFLPLFAALAALAFINRLTIWNETGMFGGLMVFLYVLIVIAVFIASIIVVLSRFYTNLLGDEGYLMFTLPVTVDQNIVSKLIAGLVWSVASFIAVLVSIGLMAPAEKLSYAIESIAQAWKAAVQVYPSFATVFWAVYVPVVIVTVVISILQFYASMAIGPMLVKNRFWGTVVAYIAISFVNRLLSGLIALLPMGKYLTAPDVLASAAAPVSIELFSQMMIATLITNIAFGVLYYFAASVVLKKRLNLGAGR